MSNPKLAKLMQLVSSHGAESDCYFLAVAAEAALRLLQQNPAEFARMFGTLGAEIINDYHD